MSAMLLARKFKILPRLWCRHHVEIAMTSSVAADFMAALRVCDLLDHIGSIPALLITLLRRGTRLVEQRCDDCPGRRNLMAIKQLDQAGTDWPFLLGSKAQIFGG